MFRIARNPAVKTRLPYLLRLPLDDGSQVFLAAGDKWPGAKDVFCLQLDEWPENAEVLEEVPIEACWQQGKAVYLVLRRRVNRRSMFVWVMARNREIIFWRTQKTMHSARPGLRVPGARKLETALAIAVDVRERYPWRFSKQQAVCTKRELPAGDYGVLLHGNLIGAVERKSVDDLASAAIAGTLSFQLAELGRLPHALLVIEGRLSAVLKKAATMQDGWLMNVIAALQVEHPAVSWVFAETRELAEDYAFRWLSAVYRTATRNEQIADPVQGVAEVPVTYEAKSEYAVCDVAGRLAAAVKLAEAGTEFTVASYMEHFQVSRGVAYGDLRRLVDAGVLIAEGNTRSRRYVPTTAGNHVPGSSAQTKAAQSGLNQL